MLRIVSAVVLAPLAIATAWIGDGLFLAFWGVAAVGVWWEWSTLVAASAARLVMLTGLAPMLIALAAMAGGRFAIALMVIALGAAAANIVAPAGRRVWVGAGTLYAASLVVTPLLLRGDSNFGFIAITFVFTVVWATDILAYCVGRLVGGPKLWPAVSPGKTWAGAVGGTAGAVVVGCGFGLTVIPGGALYPAVVGLVLSAVAQGGDLLESAVKRRFGAKDSSHLIPGHGGLMDRLDGFIAAALVAALYGGIRAGLDSSAQGLLLWTP